jgi:hypothetical protein
MSRKPSDRAADLAKQINAAWKKKNFSEPSFSEIALDVFHNSSLLTAINASSIIEWLAETASLPRQAKLDESFGQPAVTLYSDNRIHIDALFWHTAATGIHQHNFSGAFGVLEGGSMHCRYTFTTERNNDDRIRFGELKLEHWEILAPGDVREIGNGSRLIHSLFHLDAPTVSIVARTKAKKSPGIEYVYYPPFFAIDPYAANEAVHKKMQMLGLLLRLRSEKLLPVSIKVLENADLHSTFLTLLFLHSKGVDLDIFETLLEFTTKKFGQIARRVAVAAEEQRRRLDILVLRSSVTDAKQRFLLAALLNLPDRRSICAAICQRHSTSKPIDNIAALISEISKYRDIGIEFDEASEALLKCSLAVDSRADVLDRMTALYPEITDNEIKDIDAACDYFRSNNLLQPLFK